MRASSAEAIDEPPPCLARSPGAVDGRRQHPSVMSPTLSIRSGGRVLRTSESKQRCEFQPHISTFAPRTFAGDAMLSYGLPGWPRGPPQSCLIALSRHRDNAAVSREKSGTNRPNAFVGPSYNPRGVQGAVSREKSRSDRRATTVSREKSGSGRRSPTSPIGYVTDALHTVEGQSAENK